MISDAIKDDCVLNIARLKERFQVSDHEVHAAIYNGQMPLIIDVAGIFVAPVKREINGQYSQLANLQHVESGFLFVSKNYYRKLERFKPVEMGLASTTYNGAPDRLIRLRGGNDKPSFALDGLYTLEETAKQLFKQNSATQRRYAEGVEAVKRMLREKRKAGQLRNDDDAKRWMVLRHVIQYLRDHPDDFPEVAKTSPKRSDGTTKDKEPTLSKDFVGIFKDNEVAAELRYLMSQN